MSKRIIIVSVLLFALLLALVPIIIVSLNQNGDTVTDTPDTGERHEGMFVLNLEVGSDVYIFSKDGKVKQRGISIEKDPYTNEIVDTKTVEVIYDYVIAIEDGIKVLKLTDENGKVETHSFEVGTYSRNDTYKCSNENCPELNPQPTDEDNSCSCNVGKLSPYPISGTLLVIHGADYYDETYFNWFNK